MKSNCVLAVTTIALAVLPGTKESEKALISTPASAFNAGDWKGIS